ncbi:GntR family transcriptional regulator [Pseudorhodoferax soli]|jgi:DNA-binding GntR family transcriptional regulator|uniref:DNA-binding GntR family transcriptional regulator n=1 Tax=Pseudorhodoferax soli TaxID=545864 RepID=A0A368X890_9BURK|nr:GntR family transcriptional regulator [Pseudorhodoferax soli]RCW64183.1 DNA-binding GntR family transcriptional regulator [Pseudorhodoferax soli]
MDNTGTNTTTIVDALTKAIVEHRLHPGTKLAEQKLADHFGVSRTLVRQALFQLSQNRLIRLEPARGAFVAAPSVNEARQVFAVRRMLEAEMTRAFVREATPSRIKSLREHLGRQKAVIKESKDAAQRIELAGDFHLQMARLLDNEVLVQMMVELLSRCSLITLMYQKDTGPEFADDEHDALLDAISERAEERAVQLMEQHLQRLESSLTFDRKIPSNDISMALA